MKKLLRALLITAAITLFAVTSQAGSLSTRPVSGGGLGYHFSETIADGITGDAVVIPPLKVGSKRVTVTMINGANTGKIQFTTSSDALVSAGTATWQDWPKGAITGTDSDSLVGQVTALRGVSTSGEVKIEIVY